MEDAQVGGLLLVLRGGQLFLQYVEAFLQVRPPVLFQFIVDFPSSRPEHQRRLLAFRFRSIGLIYY